MAGTTAAGLPSLAITYRNDEGTPQEPSHFYGFGSTEWPDLESAVQFALNHGAKHVVLVGNSMGGAIVAAFLQHSELEEFVDAVVLDSPILNLNATVDHQVQAKSLPGPLTWTAKQLAALRYDLDWDQVDYLDGGSSWVTKPTLVFHGTGDGTAPLTDSESLASTHPDLVRLVTVEQAEHIASWNSDPNAYQRELINFIRAHS